MRCFFRGRDGSTSVPSALAPIILILFPRGQRCHPGFGFNPRESDSSAGAGLGKRYLGLLLFLFVSPAPGFLFPLVLPVSDPPFPRRPPHTFFVLASPLFFPRLIFKFCFFPGKARGKKNFYGEGGFLPSLKMIFCPPSLRPSWVRTVFGGANASSTPPQTGQSFPRDPGSLPPSPKDISIGPWYLKKTPALSFHPCV